MSSRAYPLNETDSLSPGFDNVEVSNLRLRFLLPACLRRCSILQPQTNWMTALVRQDATYTVSSLLSRASSSRNCRKVSATRSRFPM